MRRVGSRGKMVIEVLTKVFVGDGGGKVIIIDW